MSEDLRRAGRARHRTARAVAALLLTFGVLGAAPACGFSADTNQPYTPSDGTNIDIGDDGAIKVRNLVVISRATGEGIVSATVIGNTEDQLTSVTVAPFKADGSAGTPATATPASPIMLGGGSLDVLTDGPLLTVSAPDLKAGLDATITINFAKAGPVDLRAPVVDGTRAPWATISPSPSPSPSPSATG